MMQHRPSRLLPNSTALALLWTIGCMTPAFALETIVLDNVVMQNPGKATATIRRIEFIGTNLTRDEVQKIFTVGTPKEDVSALAAKLVASRITIPEVLIADKDGKIVITGVQATDVNVGKVGHFGIAGVDGNIPSDNGLIGLKSGPIAVDGAGFGGLLAVVQSGELGSATTHFGHFSWQNLEIAAPDKDTPANAPGGNIVKVKIGSMTGDGTSDGDVPLKTTAAIKDFSVELPPASAGGKALVAAGITALNLGFTFSSTYNPAAKTMAIDDLTFSGQNIGSLGLKLGLGGVDKSVFTAKSQERLMALMGGSISGLDIRFVDAGVAAKVLDFAAQQQRKTPAALKAEAAALATQFIPIVLGGHPSALKIAEQVTAFINNPKGLTVSARPKSGSLDFLDAMGLMDPKAFLEKVDVTVLAQADGATAAPAASAPAPVVSAPAASAPGAAPAAAGRLVGAAAWASLIGNSISGKNDDGDALTEYYLANGTVKQLIDDEVSTGKWVLRGAEVCFEFPDDDDESCYKLVVDGNIATFTDEDGAGRRYTVEKGNPKKL